MGTRFSRGKAIAGLLATMLVGCSDAHDGGGGGPIAAADFVAAAAEAVCDDLGDCCAQDGHPFSAQRCRSQATALLERRLARDTLIYDADAGGRCARALRESPGQCGVTDEEQTACETVFRGTVAIGAPCVEGVDCAGFPDQAVCPFGEDPEDQVCTAGAQPPPRAGRGESCGGTCRQDDDQRYCTASGAQSLGFCDTADGLYCSAATHTCEPLIAEGGACERAPDFPGCVPGTFCEHERCVPVRGDGASCLVDICVSPLLCPSRSELACASGLTCSFGADPRCTPPQADGSPCTSFVECASRNCERSCDAQSCPDVGVCSPFKHTTREQCAGLMALGEGASPSALFPGAHQAAE